MAENMSNLRKRSFMAGKPGMSDEPNKADTPLPAESSMPPKAGGIGRRILAGARSAPPPIGAGVPSRDADGDTDADMMPDMPPVGQPPEEQQEKRMAAIEESLEAIKQKLGIGSGDMDAV
jgi:hypothetical protein